MGASSSSITASASPIANLANFTTKPPLLQQQPSEETSISVLSISIESLDEVPSAVPTLDAPRIEIVAQEGYGDSGQGVLTLWKPAESNDLLKDEDEGVYISASINLDPSNKKKQRRCHCFCCKRRNKRNGKGGRSCMDTPDGSPRDSNNNLDGYPTQEVIPLQSAQDIVVVPSEAFPMEMVAHLEMTPDEVKAKPVKVRRTKVPEKPDKPLSLWGLIKSAIGKDLTKMPLPVNFAEPLSMLQRLTEDYEYSSLLDRAAKMSDPVEQLPLIAAFAISSYASTAVRTAKPFNPLLGETFEFDRTDDLGWRCIAEQVCHHPPIAALHCESAHGWIHWQQFTMKSNFKGTYLEIHPLGVAHLRFKTSDNHYTLRKVSTIVRNLYIGKIYIEQDGEMDIINHTTNEKCHLKFTCGGMFSRDRSVTGKVYNRYNEPKYEINGTWDQELRATKLDSKGKPIDNGKIIWQNGSLPSDADKRYMFSYFACQLNEMEDGVAPTDSRNRPDQRYMENAQWDEANQEKQRLEERQREQGKRRVAEGEQKIKGSKINAKSNPSKNIPVSGPEDGVEPYYTPCWFSRQRDPISGQCIYLYNGEYWSCKEEKNWSRCPALFSK